MYCIPTLAPLHTARFTPLKPANSTFAHCRRITSSSSCQPPLFSSYSESPAPTRSRPRAPSFIMHNMDGSPLNGYVHSSWYKQLSEDDEWMDGSVDLLVRWKEIYKSILLFMDSIWFALVGWYGMSSHRVSSVSEKLVEKISKRSFCSVQSRLTLRKICGDMDGGVE